MHPSLRLGLELRVPAGTPPADGELARALVHLAATAEAAGVDVLWLAPAPGRLGRGPDPCTLAGALSTATSTLGLGVVTRLETDREPSVLARDLSALDVLSAGRSALLVTGGGPRAGEALARRREAAAVCRALFTEAAPSFEGEHYRIRAAANKPPPLQPGGPPILVDLGDAGVEAIEPPIPEDRPGPIDAVVSGSGPEALGRLVEARGDGGVPAVVWRGGAEDPDGPSEGLLEALLAAGADGVIWQLDADELPEPAALATLAGALGAALGAPR